MVGSGVSAEEASADNRDDDGFCMDSAVENSVIAAIGDVEDATLGAEDGITDGTIW